MTERSERNECSSHSINLVLYPSLRNPPINSGVSCCQVVLAESGFVAFPLSFALLIYNGIEWKHEINREKEHKGKEQ